MDFSYIGEAGYDDDQKNITLINRMGLLNIGETAVDVGANHGGYTSFFASSVGAAGSVYCAEILPFTFSHLKTRFSNHSNITLLNMAISDSNGTESIYAGSSTETVNITGFGTTIDPVYKVGEVKSIKLDTLLEHEEQIAIIKIDVEGAELKVLDGMRQIANKTKALLIECHFQEDWPKIKKILLDDFGFQCYNVGREEHINQDSPMPYQCLCWREDENNSI